MRGRRADICRKNASKMDTGFVLVVDAENTTNWGMAEGVVRGATIPFMTFQADGSTTGD